jgi:hypothetical protein
MRTFPLLAALVALATVGCSEGPKVMVANHSEHTLKNVTMSGTGFSTSIAEIVPNSSEAVTVHPSGESSIRVFFYADGKRIDSGTCCYFENNPQYTIAVSVNGDLKVTVLSNLGKY